jgi:DNA-binding cell septation regulator SpoVG
MSVHAFEKSSFQIEHWQPRRKGKLFGFVTIRLGQIKIADIRICDGPNGPFVAMPSSSWTDRNGKVNYTPIVSFANKTEGQRFSEALVAQLRTMDSFTFRPDDGDATVTELRPGRTDESITDAQPGLRKQPYRP